MTGIWLDVTGWLAGRRDAAATPGDKLVASESCLAIMTIADDFQDIVRASCPRCQDGSGECLVERMRTVAEGDDPA